MEYKSQPLNFIFYEEGAEGPAGQGLSAQLEYYIANDSMFSVPDVTIPNSGINNPEGWYTKEEFFKLGGPWDTKEEISEKPYVWKIICIKTTNPEQIILAAGPILLSDLESATMAAAAQIEYSTDNEDDKVYASAVGKWCSLVGKTIIDGGTIMTGSIGAEQIAVEKLSAITANMGTIEAGKIVGGYEKTEADISKEETHTIEIPSESYYISSLEDVTYSDAKMVIRLPISYPGEELDEVNFKGFLSFEQNGGEMTLTDFAPCAIRLNFPKLFDEFYDTHVDSTEIEKLYELEKSSPEEYGVILNGFFNIGLEFYHTTTDVNGNDIITVYYDGYPSTGLTNDDTDIKNLRVFFGGGSISSFGELSNCNVDECVKANFYLVSLGSNWEDSSTPESNDDLALKSLLNSIKFDFSSGSEIICFLAKEGGPVRVYSIWERTDGIQYSQIGSIDSLPVFFALRDCYKANPFVGEGLEYELHESIYQGFQSAMFNSTGDKSAFMFRPYRHYYGEFQKYLYYNKSSTFSYFSTSISDGDFYNFVGKAYLEYKIDINYLGPIKANWSLSNELEQNFNSYSDFQTCLIDEEDIIGSIQTSLTRSYNELLSSDVTNEENVHSFSNSNFNININNNDNKSFTINSLNLYDITVGESNQLGMFTIDLSSCSSLETFSGWNTIDGDGIYSSCYFICVEDIILEDTGFKLLVPVEYTWKEITINPTATISFEDQKNPYIDFPNFKVNGNGEIKASAGTIGGLQIVKKERKYYPWIEESITVASLQFSINSWLEASSFSDFYWVGISSDIKDIYFYENALAEGYEQLETDIILNLPENAVVTNIEYIDKSENFLEKNIISPTNYYKMNNSEFINCISVQGIIYTNRINMVRPPSGTKTVVGDLKISYVVPQKTPLIANSISLQGENEDFYIESYLNEDTPKITLFSIDSIYSDNIYTGLLETPNLKVGNMEISNNHISCNNGKITFFPYYESGTYQIEASFSGNRYFIVGNFSPALYPDLNMQFFIRYKLLNEDQFKYESVAFSPGSNFIERTLDSKLEIAMVEIQDQSGSWNKEVNMFIDYTQGSGVETKTLKTNTLITEYASVGGVTVPKICWGTFNVTTKGKWGSEEIDFSSGNFSSVPTVFVNIYPAAEVATTAGDLYVSSSEINKDGATIKYYTTNSDTSTETAIYAIVQWIAISNW